MRFATVDDKFEVGQTVFLGHELPRGSGKVFQPADRYDKWTHFNTGVVTRVFKNGAVAYKRDEGPVYLRFYDSIRMYPNENGIYIYEPHRYAFWVLDAAEEREFRVAHARWFERDYRFQTWVYRNGTQANRDFYRDKYKAALAALEELGG